MCRQGKLEVQNFRTKLPRLKKDCNLSTNRSNGPTSPDKLIAGSLFSVSSLYALCSTKADKNATVFMVETGGELNPRMNTIENIYLRKLKAAIAV